MKVRMEILQNGFQSIVVTKAGDLKNRRVLGFPRDKKIFLSRCPFVPGQGQGLFD